MNKVLRNVQNHFLQDYGDLPLSIQIKTRYLIYACLLGLLMVSLSTLTYAIAGTWAPLLGNGGAGILVATALFLIKKKKYVAASNIGLSAILASLLLFGLNDYFFTGFPDSRISELGDTIVHFQFGLVFVGFASYRIYQPIIFTLAGIVSVIITYYLAAERHGIDFFSPEYTVKLGDALTFLTFSGLGAVLSFTLFNTLIKNLQSESDKVNNVNQQLETTVKLRTIELEVANVELKEKSAELEKFNKILQEAKLKAEEASIAKEQFLSTMSHEIRTPLNAVIGMTHLLLEEAPRKDQEENLDVLQVSAKNLLNLINDILDFSKIESGKIELEEILFSPNDLFRDLHKMFIYKAKEKNLALELVVSETTPKFLRGDSGRLAQIVSNLLSNAIKFTEKGIVKISIDAIPQNNNETTELVISVNDTGIGIPDDKKQHIFESFTQASSETTRKYGGTGLGLAIIKKLVEIQNGNIHVTSSPGKGSCFVVHIPYQNAAQPAPEQPDAKKYPVNFKDLKVLLVEDNIFNQEVVSKILSNWGIITETCDSGKVCIELVQKNNYDLILMDINLPDIDGYSITRKIRAMENEEKSTIPIIAQTAEISTQSLQESKEAGMNDIIPKPIIPNNLIEKIRTVLELQNT